MRPAPLTPGLVAPATLEIQVSAEDSDGAVSQVEIYLSDTLLGTSSSEPLTLTASNLSAGDYFLTAVATDDSGLTATSAPVAITVSAPPVVTTMIATGSVWKYLDNGSDQGAGWKETGFDDSTWAAGPALLGYGGLNKNPPRPEATMINPGCCGLSGPKYITDYFRHRFVVSSAAQYTNLYFRVLRDDGVVVYLNGTEIFRMNMPDGPINYQTQSSTTVGGTNETFRFPANTSAALLVDGANLLAVELHQSSPNTSDAAFDLRLDGIGAPGSEPIALSITNNGSEIVISWTASGAVLEETANLGGNWTNLTAATSSPYRTAPAAASKFYRLRKP